MSDVIDKIRNIVRVDQLSSSMYLVNLPLLYTGGDWVSLTITENPSGTFSITDSGNAILNTLSLTDSLEQLHLNRYVSKIVNEFSISSTKEFNLYLSDIQSEQLHSAMIDVAAASQKLSNILVDQTLHQIQKDFCDLVEDKLKIIFKNKFKEKVIQNYGVTGNSSKKYSIPFCINLPKKRLIEPTLNNANSIATTHMMFFDIDKSPEYSREVVIDDYSKWDTTNIEILKPICDRITPYEGIAA